MGGPTPHTRPFQFQPRLDNDGCNRLLQPTLTQPRTTDTPALLSLSTAARGLGHSALHHCVPQAERKTTVLLAFDYCRPFSSAEGETNTLSKNIFAFIVHLCFD